MEEPDRQVQMVTYLTPVVEDEFKTLLQSKQILAGMPLAASLFRPRLIEHLFVAQEESTTSWDVLERFQDDDEQLKIHEVVERLLLSPDDFKNGKVKDDQVFKVYYVRFGL